MIRLILQFWPALLPLMLYGIWCWLRRRRARRLGITPAPLLRGRWVWVAMASAAMLILCFLWIGISAPANHGTDYTPKQFKDGTLVEEQFE